LRVDGDAIQSLRIAKGKDLADLARIADLGVRRIRQIEAKEHVNINRNIAKSIAVYLGVKLDAIALKE